MLFTCITIYPKFILISILFELCFCFVYQTYFLCLRILHAGFWTQVLPTRFQLNCQQTVIICLSRCDFYVRYATAHNSPVYFYVSIIFIFVENFYIRLRIVTFRSQISPVNKLHLYLYVNFLFLMYNLIMAIYFSRSMHLFSNSLRM